MAAGEVDAKVLLLPLLLGWSCSRSPGLGVRKESWVWNGAEWRQERFLPSPPPPNDQNPPGQTRTHLCPPSRPTSKMQMTYRGGWCLSHRGIHTPGPALRGAEKRDPIGGEGVECWATTPRQQGGLATQRQRVWAAHHSPTLRAQKMAAPSLPSSRSFTYLCSQPQSRTTQKRGHWETPFQLSHVTTVQSLPQETGRSYV